jgi:GRAM domain-containing protein 4
MALYPTYIPLIRSLLYLATWKSPGRSSFFCFLYFILWFYDSLIPAFILYILLGSLLRRRLHPYPSPDELRGRMKRTREAEALGAAMDESSFSKFGAFAQAGDFGLWDAWRILHDSAKSRKEKLKAAAADSVLQKLGDLGQSNSQTTETPLLSDDEDGLARKNFSKLEKEAYKQAKKEAKRRQEENDWRRTVVAVLEAVADIHERVKK